MNLCEIGMKLCEIGVKIVLNYNKTYLTIAEGLSNCEVSLGQYCGL